MLNLVVQFVKALGVMTENPNEKVGLDEDIFVKIRKGVSKLLRQTSFVMDGAISPSALMMPV